VRLTQGTETDVLLQPVEQAIAGKRVDFREVGLREGLQSHDLVLDTGEKVELFAKLRQAGCREINAVAFVHPEKMPQMADAEEVLRALGPLREGVTISALVPNERAFARALRMREAGLLDAILLVFAESVAALVANGMTPSHEPLFDQIERTAAAAAGTGLDVSVFISTAYGCSVQGRVDADAVVQHAKRLWAMDGVSELVISDSTGQADPLQVLRTLTALSHVLPRQSRLAVHFHDTRGAGLANIFAALLSPFEHLVIDGAFGGWGGDWPMLEEAYGNVATEDVVEMLVGLGIDVGVNVEQICEVTRWYADLSARPVNAKLPSASPIGWKRSAGTVPIGQ
jgi:isopropylmalate/homocitrate/citramalate synthase